MTRTPTGDPAPLAHLSRGSRAYEARPTRSARHARPRHEGKLSFLGHTIIYGLSLMLIAITAGPFVALVVALGWGIGLASHGFFGVLAPALRARWDQPPSAAPPERVVNPPAFDESRARSLEELSAAIAHEIRNPITAARSILQQIVEDPNSSDIAKHSQVALEELDRVERSIAHLLRYAREVPFNPTTVDVRDLIESSLDLFRDRAAREHVQIVREWDELPIIQADGEQLRQVLANLLGNALDALAADHTANALIEVSGGLNLAGTEVWIRVSDNGPGIPPDLASKLFRPFFTTKVRGTGLGLSLSKKFVERHGGTIELSPAAGGGAAFVVHLPLAPAGGARA
jgi:signal transduction histidine kinase